MEGLTTEQQHMAKYRKVEMNAFASKITKAASTMESLCDLRLFDVSNDVFTATIKEIRGFLNSMEEEGLK